MTAMRKVQNQEAVAASLAAIPHLHRSALIEHWMAAYGRMPPKGISRRLLEFSAAYRIQVQAYGGLKPNLRCRLLQSLEAGKAHKKHRKGRSDALSSGTRLIREWRGRTYTVDVVDGGFLWEERPYRSLSEIARIITGARWSGPRFFRP